MHISIQFSICANSLFQFFIRRENLEGTNCKFSHLSIPCAFSRLLKRKLAYIKQTFWFRKFIQSNMKSIFTISLLATFLNRACSKDVPASVIFPTADAGIRRDRSNQNFGYQPNITVTKISGTKARAALLNFDTSHLDKSNSISAMLMLFISGTDNDEFRTVKISKVSNSFEEHDVTWESYASEDVGENGPADYVSFEVHRDDIGKAGHIDVSRLIKEGDDSLTVVIHVENGGHVKLASKDHDNKNLSPRLLVSNVGEL